MRNKSVTKRRRKIRTGRIKTHQPQSKRCKKISPQIGGGIFTRNGGWDCECRVDGKVPETVNYEEEEEDEYDEHGNPQPTRRILDGTNKVLKDKYYAVLSSSKRIQIYDVSKGVNLPKHLENRDIITEIKTDEKSKAIPVINIEKIQDFYKIINRLRSKPVILTISRKHIGGSGNDNQLHVRVNLESLPQQPAEVSNVPTRSRQANVGGKKTTYRRKKHVTRRKINTKRRKVMVGGGIPDSTGWNSLGLDGKFNAIEAVSSIEELQTIWSYIVQLKDTTPNDKEYKELSNKVAVRKQELESNLKKKTVICECSKTERNKGNDKRKETSKGETEGKGEML